MSINPIQFQKGLSPAEFMQQYGREEQCARLWQSSLAEWILLSPLPARSGIAVPARRAVLLAVQRLSAPDQPASRHPDGTQPAAAQQMVLGNVSDDAVENQHCGTGLDAATGHLGGPLGCSSTN